MANKYICVTLSEKEKEKLREISGKTGLSMRGFVRMAISNCNPREKPSKTFLSLINELKELLNSLYPLRVEHGEVIERIKEKMLELEREYYLSDEKLWQS